MTLADAPPNKGEKPQTHIMMGGPGKLDITNAEPKTLLQFGADETRVTAIVSLPEKIYNLHVEVPAANPKILSRL